MNDAAIMKEKQRIAELKKKGIVEEPVKEEKFFDKSYMKEYNFEGGVNEEVKETSDSDSGGEKFDYEANDYDAENGFIVL